MKKTKLIAKKYNLLVDNMKRIKKHVTAFDEEG